MALWNNDNWYRYIYIFTCNSFGEKEITVFIKIIDNSPSQDNVIKKLNPDDHLFKIRKELESSNVINDNLLFSKKVNEEFGELKREDEEKFFLNETLTVENGQDTLYLTAKKENSKEINVFIKIIDNSLLQGHIMKKLNSEDRLSEIRKELESGDVINDMLLFSKKENNEFGVGSSRANVGVDFNNSEKTSEFYNFNHIKLLGGKHPDDKNFDEKAWIESLKDYQNWECIEFRNPISIFQLLDDELRKQTFETIGKRIIHTNTEDCVYHLNECGRHNVFELNNISQDILEIIHDEEADCDVFASVYEANENSKNVFFNCQILREPSAKPCIIIHGIRKDFKQCRYNLKVRIMISGYDTNFNFILPNTIGVKLIKNDYDPQNPCKFHSIPLQQKLDLMLAKNIPFFGIPVLENLTKSLIIGHNFRKVEKKKCYVDLPKVTFCTLIISNYPDPNFYASRLFNSKLPSRKPSYIDLKPNNTFQKFPKLVSQNQLFIFEICTVYSMILASY
uniref:MACPF domain-containing protein n=1 Tax=Rhizophagus irregularis (strain DAOM 181602 / DAOM 197198 / MUCL 43194) TaxID=747089 RepID=U9T519_RHIID